VTWRYDNNNCGWAPLPPNSVYTPGFGFTYFGSSVGASYGFSLGVGSYIFVPWGRFCDPYPYRHCLPTARTVAIYDQTTIVNNYGNGNTTVINRGISPDRVREHARTEVRTVTLRTEPTPGVSPRADRLEGGGRTLVVNRPAAFQPVAGSTTPTGVASNPRVSTPRGGTPGRNEPGRPARPAPGVRQGGGNPSAPATLTDSGRNSSFIIPPPAASGEGRVATPRNQGSQGAASVVRLPETPAATPAPAMPVTRPTPIFSRPIIVERRTTPNAPANQPITIGGNQSGRATGRDYSVWSTPTTRPAQNSSSAPTAPATFSGGQNTGGNTSPNSILPPSSRTSDLNRPRNNGYQPREILAERSQQAERSSRARLEERSAAQNYSAPSVYVPRPSAPVIINPTPSAPASAPARPSYTPAPSAPRVQSQPTAPSRSDSARQDSGANSGRPGNR
jgi:hypothetical protein